jgi:hypothetical protein
VHIVLGFHYRKRKNRMKKYRWFAVYTLLVVAVAAVFAFQGCEQTAPKPIPNPAGLSIVVLYDASDAADTASYADPTLDKYAKDKGHELRIHAINVTDEGKWVNGVCVRKPETPEYLKPYVAAAKDKKLPFVMLGSGGTIKGSIEQPANVQALIAYLDKTLGEVVPADAFWAGGEWRKLAKPTLMAARLGVENRWTVEGSTDREPLIPQEQWVEIDMTPFIWAVKNQGNLSSCCPTSGCSVIEISAARAGLKPFKLSVADGYARINGGRDAGANLEDFTSIATDAGICTTEFCTEQAVKVTRQAGYEKSRAKHRVLKATYCPDFAAIASAIQRHKPVHFGLLVDSGFSPNDKGIIGPKRGSSGGGHALVMVGMKKVNGEWYGILLNSWGETWGGSKDGAVPKGCCLIHPSYIEPMFGSFAYSSIVSPSDDAIAFTTAL